MKLKEEIAWSRTNPKARTTKQTARLKACDALQEEVSNQQTRLQTRELQLDFTGSERLTQKLVTVRALSQTIGDGKLLFQNLEMTISPGMRVAVVGGNGLGKSTLLNTLMKRTPPTLGTVKHADFLKIALFDQHRRVLEDHLTLQETLSPNSEFVEFGGKTLHVAGFAERLAFSKEMLRLPLKFLSGGEKARLAIGRFMLESADLFLLDEPTNDLDIATIELLEENLMQFSGASLFISHDRRFIEKLATHILSWEPGGDAVWFSSIDQYQKWKDREKPAVQVKPLVNTPPIKNTQKKQETKLSFSEKQEYSQLPERIEKLEAEIFQLSEELSRLTSFQEIEVLSRRLGLCQEQRDFAWARWEVLEEKVRCQQ
jgi:ATPase components of ABC transporters with duplicated ATPase domains